MDKLPLEVLVHILSFLPPSERLNSALVCRSWARAVSTPELLEDVWLAIYTSRQLKAAETVLMRSDRKFRNLRLVKVSPLVTYYAGFWTVVGRRLRKLEIDNCSFSPRVLNEILLACSELESLEISSLGSESLSSENFRWEEIQGPFRSVRHLKPPFGSTEAAFVHLLRILPNVTSISLKLSESSGNLENLPPGLLGENRLITELEVDGTAPGSGYLLASLIGLCSASVEVLRVLDGLRSKGAYGAIGDCTNLRRLTVSGPRHFLDDDDMKKILLNNPGLEALELRDCESLTDKGLTPLHQLKRLRQLVFDHCLGNITPEFLCSLRTIPSLQDVQFQGVKFGGRVADVGFFREIASLPNLQTICLGHDRVPEDSESLRVILHDFKNLKELRILKCTGLTESDFAKLRQFRHLRILELHDAGELTDLAVAEGFGSSALESLALTGCPLTDHGLASIGAHHSRLRNLHLVGCGNITAAGLVVLLERESLLQLLAIHHTLWTEKFCEALEKLCPQLRYCLSYPFGPRERLFPEPFQTRRPAVFLVGSSYDFGF